MPSPPIPTHFVMSLVVLIGMTLPACAEQSLQITNPGQGQVTLRSGQINQLSGITYLGGDDYLVVSDKGARIARATIVVDRKTGHITRASIGEVIKLNTGRDLEDVAYLGGSKFLLVDEADQSIKQMDLSKREPVSAFKVPSVFQKARPNLGLESLAITPDRKTVWTANEEALSVDGTRSTGDRGTIVRLQRFDARGKPAGQFAYRTQHHAGADNFLKRAQSGVSGLVAIGGGHLIVLERELGGASIPAFRSRLYLVGTKRAKDISKLASLEKAPAKPLAKRLLIRVDAGLANYEGVTLGPRLNNGDHALLLIADNGGGRINPQCLLALRVSGLVRD